MIESADRIACSSEVDRLALKVANIVGRAECPEENEKSELC